MSQTIDCPKCGEPMDVPAYPGDGVYTVHRCPAPPIDTGRKASREEQHARYIDCGPAAWDDR